jgi:hypothetical protein
MPEIGKHAAFFLDGWNLSPYFQSWEGPPSTYESLDTTSFGPTTDETSDPGAVVAGAWKGEGWWRATTAEPVETTLRAATGAAGTLAAFYPRGDAVGYVGFLWPAEQLDYTLKQATRDLVRTGISGKVTGARRNAYSLHADGTARTSPYSGDIFDAGDATADAVWYAQLHATEVTSDFTALIETSANSDLSAAVTLVTFTAIPAVAERGAERKTGSGVTVFRYWRIRVTAGAAKFHIGLAAGSS